MVKDSDTDCTTRKNSMIPFSQDDSDNNLKATSYLVGDNSTCNGDGKFTINHLMKYLCNNVQIYSL